MRLNFDQICQFTIGAVSIEEADDGIHFYRYTDKQADAFATEARCFLKRSAHTSGIRIDFQTNSESLDICVGSAGKYEVLVDDLTAFYQNFDIPSSFSLHLDSGIKRVTIVLPSHSVGTIRWIGLDDDAILSEVDYPFNFIFYGDSITQGWNSEKDSQSYAWLVSRYYDANSMILGVGGSNFYPDTVDENGFDADVVIVAMGTNDYCGGFTLEEIRSNCSAYLTRVCSIHSNAKRFFITPTWRADEDEVFAAGKLSDVCNILAEEALQHKMIVVNGHTLIPHRSEYFVDGLHPNDLGFALYAQNLIKVLNQHL